VDETTAHQGKRAGLSRCDYETKQKCSSKIKIHGLRYATLSSAFARVLRSRAKGSPTLEKISPTVLAQEDPFYLCRTGSNGHDRGRGVTVRRDRPNRRYWQANEQAQFLTRCRPCNQSII